MVQNSDAHNVAYPLEPLSYLQILRARRRIAYAYLHRGYDMRIADCERALAKALMGENGR